MLWLWLMTLLGMNASGKRWGSPEPVLYVGLPPEIPADFLREAGFIAFKEVPESEVRERRKPRHYAMAPLGSDFFFNDQPVNARDREALHEVFSEAMYAYVPEGAKIRVSRNSNGLEVWDYPVGMAVGHMIRFKTPEPTVFELRLVVKVERDRWAFGSYSPSPSEPAGPLRLNTYEGWPRAQFRVPIRRADGDMMTDVRLKRIKLNTCQACHFSNSLSDDQYEVRGPDGKLDYWKSVARTGPCGFVPGDEFIKARWESKYKSAHGGVSPFEDSP